METINLIYFSETEPARANHFTGGKQKKFAEDYSIMFTRQGGGIHCNLFKHTRLISLVVIVNRDF